MKRTSDAGKWWVSLNGKEVFRGFDRGPALSYASSLVLVSVFERKDVEVGLHGPQGIVWSYQADPDLALLNEESAAVVHSGRVLPQPVFRNG